MRRMRRRGPQREPHPDPRVEARLQGILARYAAVTRTEGRLEDISGEQQAVDAKIRAWADSRSRVTVYEKQADRLRDERAGLEAFIRAAHEDITAMLAALGDDALELGAFR